MSSINFHLEEQDQEGRSCRYSTILVAGSYTVIFYVVTLYVTYLDNKSLDSMRNIDPLELELVEEIAQGGQAHIYLTKFKSWGDLEVVVKR